jgi:hypothetical protein
VEAGLRYRESRERITALVTELSATELDRPVAATPGRTVRDLGGVPVEITAGGIDGVSTPTWSQSRIDLSRVELETVLEEWAAMGPAIESLADRSVAVGDRLVADVACHEHDLRGALDRPGERDSATVDQARQASVLRLDGRLKSEGAAGLRLRAAETEWILGPAEPAATLTTDPFTLFRLLFGRRSRAQLAALAWTADPDRYLDLLGQYPPAVADLVE